MDLGRTENGCPSEGLLEGLVVIACLSRNCMPLEEHYRCPMDAQKMDVHVQDIGDVYCIPTKWIFM